MWYVIQTKTGNEIEVKTYLEANLFPERTGWCFVPLYEEVRRREGKSHILFRKLFPGYLFVDINKDDIDSLYQTLKRMPDFTRLLGGEGDDGAKLFIPIDKEDEEFLGTLLQDGIMHVSYVQTAIGSNKIEKIIGPLGRYRNHITKVRTNKREAVVDINMFGRRHVIHFGLWNDQDAKLPIFDERMEESEEKAIDGNIIIDTGISPGDKVICTDGAYEGYTFTVERVNPNQRTIKTKIDLFGGIRNIELYIDQVERI